ncbi:MAG: electron transfer flavoprotein subunit beta/FixA family protein, partial [Actinobacteria bacterium]|nr:electron transfer flavoprotein subunit beta/FixA family protein [Actinomycetota bacterium]
MLSDLDRRAIEEGLRLKESGTATDVVLIAMAPASSTGAIVDALAMGVDRAIHVADRSIEGSDLLVTSRVLAQAIGRESPDLVLFGPQGEESSGAMLWAAVAARLSLPVLSQADELAVADGRAQIVRQTEAGYETLAAPLPCVVGVTGSINQPRFAPIKGKLTARTKPNSMVTVAELGVAGDQVGAAGSGTRVLAIKPPPSRGD